MANELQSKRINSPVGSHRIHNEQASMSQVGVPRVSAYTSSFIWNWWDPTEGNLKVKLNYRAEQ